MEDYGLEYIEGPAAGCEADAGGTCLLLGRRPGYDLAPRTEGRYADLDPEALCRSDGRKAPPRSPVSRPSPGSDRPDRGEPLGSPSRASEIHAAE